MKYDVRKMCEKFALDPEMKVLPFYGHSVTKKVSSSCMSNWYPCTFEVDEGLYHTTEQYMMAQKARLFGDHEVLLKIMNAKSPRAYKFLGRQVKGYSEEVWNKHRFEIVLRGVHAKFSQNPELKAFLLSTGDAVLVEASPSDCIWGIGLSKKDERCMDPNQWCGTNLLGFVLMEVRDLLREGIELLPEHKEEEEKKEEEIKPVVPEFVMPEIAVGTRVIHKAFGSGEITELPDESHLVARFGGKTVKFIREKAFKDGFLSLAE